MFLTIEWLVFMSSVFNTFYGFVVRNIPIYGEASSYSEKTKKLNNRIAVLSGIKVGLEQELAYNGRLVGNRCIVLTTQEKEEIEIRIQSLSRRIQRLKLKIEKEGTKSSISIVGQVAGTLGNFLVPGSGIFIASTTAAVKTTYHNSQAATLEEPTKLMSVEVGRALTSSLASKHLTGFAKELLP